MIETSGLSMKDQQIVEGIYAIPVTGKSVYDDTAFEGFRESF